MGFSVELAELVGAKCAPYGNNYIGVGSQNSLSKGCFAKHLDKIESEVNEYIEWYEKKYKNSN